MDHNHLPINKIQVITKITDNFTLDDSENINLYEHVIQYLNTNANMISLEWCAKNGKLEIIKSIMKKYDCDPEQTVSLTKLAAKNGHIEIVNYFLTTCKRNYDLHKLATEALHFAVQYNHFDLVKFLVDKGASISDKYYDSNAIVASMKNDNTEITEYLIKRNCKKNNTRILMSGYPFDNLDVVKMLIENCDGEYNKDDLLVNNVENYFMDAVKYLIDRDFDYYVSNIFELIQYVRQKQARVEIIEYLLEQYPDKFLSIPDNIITKKVNNFNKLLIQHANENQYDLFDPEIVKTLVNRKSARNV